ncbi:unnamed protein product [Calypogeia fissa]
MPPSNEDNCKSAIFVDKSMEKHCSTLSDQYFRELNKLTSIDNWPQQKSSKSLVEGLNLEASHKKGVGDRRDGDKINKRSTNGHGLVFHHRQGSGDLYTKLHHSDFEDNLSWEDYSRRNSYKSSSTSGEPQRFVVKGYGSWGDIDGKTSSPTLIYNENSTCPTKPQVGKLSSVPAEYKNFPSTILEGIPPSPPPGSSSRAGGGGVLGLKEWYKNRTLVSKATSQEEAPTKPKYLRKLVLSSWKHNGSGANGIFNMLRKRPLQSSPVMALKGLIIIHKLLQQGSPSCQTSCFNKRSILSDIGTTFRSPVGSAGIEASREAYNPVVSSYASVLVEKVSFHKIFPNYESNYSIGLGISANQPSSSGKVSPEMEKGNALTYLQKILDMVFVALEKGFALLQNKSDEVELTIREKTSGARILPLGSVHETSHVAKIGFSNPIELAVSMLIPMLKEADLLYEICSFLISSQSSLQQENHSRNGGIAHQVAKFRDQHKMLRKYFELAKSEVSITCKVTPPNLPLYLPFSFQIVFPRNDIALRSSHENSLERDINTTRCKLKLQPMASLDVLAQSEVGKPQPIPPERQKRLEDAQAQDLDDSWVNSIVGKVIQHRSQDMDGPVVGGVGAAAAAALHRFAAGQTEVRRAPTPLIGVKNIRLEPPPCKWGYNSLRESRAHFRPERPQHTRGVGRKWSSFDDQAFLHQKLDGNRWSPIPKQNSPKFYYPKALVPSNGVGGMPRTHTLESSSPLLQGLKVGSSQNSKVVSPLVRSPTHVVALDLNVCPAHCPVLPSKPEIQEGEDYLMDLPEFSKYSTSVVNVGKVDLERPNTRPMTKLDTLPKHQSTIKILDKQVNTTEQHFLQGVPPASWRLEGSMSDATAWSEHAYRDACIAQPGKEGACNLKETPKDTPLASDWEIPASEIKLGTKIGQGAFGDVLGGTWQGTEVAVKRLQNNFNGASYLQAIEEIRHEVAVIMRLRHPNIILFMVVRWATEAARGMNYLHTRNPPVVHRDLKSVNLLVDGDWHIKVSDFGLAMTKQSSYAYTQVGTWGWMAPEVLESSPYNEKADVYSFGIVLWELITREEPFKGYHPMQIMRAIDRGERPPIPLSCPQLYKQLIVDCWHANPKCRPEFLGILGQLADISNSLNNLIVHY